MVRDDPEELERIVNGCGPKYFGALVPDELYGMDMEPACNIHDFMYHFGRTHLDKEVADRSFLNNVVRLAMAISDPTTEEGRELLDKRLEVAYFYFNAVAKYGGPAYWAGKNDPAEEGEVAVAA
jgi:hypothetical protein